MANIKISEMAPGSPVTSTDEFAIARGGANYRVSGIQGMALQDPAAVAITGGSISGITDLPVADGGTGASNASAARTNLGLEIGTNVQSYYANLEAVGGLGSTGLITLTAAGAASARTITAATGGSISVTNGSGVSGNPTIGVDIIGTTTETVSDAANDYVLVYDASAGANRKFLLNNISSGLAAADQAAQEAASSNTVAVTPGTQVYHPSAAKAWVKITVSGGTPSAVASHNVSSITDNGVGDFTVNFTSAFSSANYGVAGLGRNTSSSDGCIALSQITAPAAGSCRVYGFLTSSSTLTDNTEHYITFFGDR